MPGVKLAPGLISVSSEMMPQPICSPASNDPPVSLVEPSPVIFPVKVPATRYSRDEIAVVSGATGSWVSLLPTTSRCQPSGVSRTPGGPDGTPPSGGSGLVTFTGAAGSGGGGGGSANARGAVPSGISDAGSHCGKTSQHGLDDASRGRNPGDPTVLSRGSFYWPGFQTVNRLPTGNARLPSSGNRGDDGRNTLTLKEFHRFKIINGPQVDGGHWVAVQNSYI